MGLFCCCFRPKVFENERTRILDADRSGHFEVLNSETLSEITPSINALLYRTPTVGLSEQNLFDITVQKMASKMINIPALNDQLPQTFCMDRQRMYAKKVLNLRNPLPLRSDLEKCRSKTESPTPLTFQERCTKICAISEEDLNLIKTFSQKTSNVVKRGFNYWSDEPIVVEFNPSNN